jgi:uncharacterized cupredoxin-like copper-binding protein
MPRSALPFFLLLALLAYAPVAAAAAPDHAGTDSKARKKARAPEQPYGREGDPRKVNRVIRVDMSDTMRFFPSELRVKRGDTVRFVVRNSGELPHELVIGTMDELKKYAALMKKGEDIGHVHALPNAAHAERGKSARLVWQFTRPGEFYYACMVPGHFEAGMIGTIVVR